MQPCLLWPTPSAKSLCASSWSNQDVFSCSWLTFPSSSEYLVGNRDLPGPNSNVAHTSVCTPGGVGDWLRSGEEDIDPVVAGIIALGGKATAAIQVQPVAAIHPVLK